MTYTKLILAAVVAATAAYAVNPTVSDSPEARIARAARHEILMLPNFGVFDNIELRVQGYAVTLTGHVTRPALKDEAGKAVRRIEGVEAVKNDIEVLPLSPNDDRLRLALYRAIYEFAPLERYALPVIKPIRIIVKDGNVTLEGVVDNQADQNIVRLRANGVPGVFTVTTNLRVE